MGELVADLWKDLVEDVVTTVSDELELHEPGGPFDYAKWGDFGSPIETAMFIALTINAHEHGMTTKLKRPLLALVSATMSPVDPHNDDYYVIGHNFGEDYRTTIRTVFPQCNIGKYRVDFMVEQGWGGGDRHRVVIECDGHDFHERTKEQVGRDKARDRYMQTFGVSVLRFSGSEINKDPHGCASQVAKFFEAREAESFARLEAEFRKSQTPAGV